MATKRCEHCAHWARKPASLRGECALRQTRQVTSTDANFHCGEHKRRVQQHALDLRRDVWRMTAALREENSKLRAEVARLRATIASLDLGAD